MPFLIKLGFISIDVLLSHWLKSKDGTEDRREYRVALFTYINNFPIPLLAVAANPQIQVVVPS